MELTKSIIRADIIAAKQAIEYFDQKGTKEIKNIAAYHLQQAAEKLIKYQIYQGLKSTDNHRINGKSSKLLRCFRRQCNGFAPSKVSSIKTPETHGIR